MSLARSASKGGTKKDDSSAKFTLKPYSGDQNLYQAFRDSIELFFLINDKFANDDKKITFILSLLNNGEAQTWRTNYIRKQRTNGLLTFPLFSEFLIELDKTFKRKHEEDKALFNLNQMKQLPKEDADTAITRFKEQASLAGVSLTEQPRLAIDYLRSVLHPSLVDKISLNIDEPKTFEEWADLAVRYDNTWRKSQLLKATRGPPRNNFGNFNRGNL